LSEGQSSTATVQVTAGVAVAMLVGVSPAQANVAVGQNLQLSAVVRDANGTVISNAPVTWSTSNLFLAGVSSTGLVTGVAAGTATITATSGTAYGTASISVQVQQAAVDRIVVTPRDPTIDVGKTVQLVATLTDKQGNVLTGRTVTWTSSDPSRATVSNTGLVSGIKGGTVTITASSGGKSGTTNVRVK